MISIVLAFANPDNIATRTTVATTMVTIRVVMLSRILQITTGTNRRTSMSDAVKVRVDRLMNGFENACMFVSVEMSLRRCWLLD